MSQKSSVPQAAKSVAQVLVSDTIEAMLAARVKCGDVVIIKAMQFTDVGTLLTYEQAVELLRKKGQLDQAAAETFKSLATIAKNVTAEQQCTIDTKRVAESYCRWVEELLRKL